MKYNFSELLKKNAIPWYSNDKGRIIIVMINFFNLLKLLGIHIASIYGAKNIVKIRNNVVTIIDKHTLVQEVLKWLEALYVINPEIEEHINSVKEALIYKIPRLIDDTSLTFMQILEIEPHFDTENECYLYFRNIAIKITKDEINLIAYNNLDDYVLKDQIIDRDFNLPDIGIENIHPFYKKFISNVCKGVEERIDSLESIIGYMLHRFQNPSNAKAIILLDENINELSAVRVGLGKACSLKL